VEKKLVSVVLFDKGDLALAAVKQDFTLLTNHLGQRRVQVTFPSVEIQIADQRPSSLVRDCTI
jgi:hypothetical protein